MVYSRAWDETQPLGTMAANLLDDTIRNLKTDLRERLNEVFGIDNFGTVDSVIPKKITYKDGAVQGAVFADLGNTRFTVGSDTDHDVALYSNNTLRWRILKTGEFVPEVDNTGSIGTAARRVNKIYSEAFRLGNNDEKYITYVGNTLAMIVSNAAGRINFQTGAGGATRWIVDQDGHFVSGVDNSFDIGYVGTFRPRDLFLARNLNVAGTATITGVTTLTSGVVNGNFVVTSANGRKLGFSTPEFIAGVTNTLDLGGGNGLINTFGQPTTATSFHGWYIANNAGNVARFGNSSASPNSSVFGVFYNESAGLGSNVNQTNAENFGLSRFAFFGGTVGAATSAITFASGGGGGAAVTFTRGGGYDTAINFYTNIGSNAVANGLTARWQIAADGGIYAHADNLYDIGISGSNRPRNIYVASKVQATDIQADRAILVKEVAVLGVTPPATGGYTTFYSQQNSSTGVMELFVIIGGILKKVSLI